MIIQEIKRIVVVLHMEALRLHGTVVTSTYVDISPTFDKLVENANKPGNGFKILYDGPPGPPVERKIFGPSDDSLSDRVMELESQVRQLDDLYRLMQQRVSDLESRNSFRADI